MTKIANNGRVIFGCTVKIYNTETEEEITYNLVGDDEANIKENRISINSPIARGLVGKSVDDVAMVKTPGGAIEFEIVSVEYI